MIRRILHRLCDPNDLDDLVQMAFVKIHQNLHNLRDEKLVKAWVCRIAVNTAYDYLRHKKRNRWLAIFAPSDLPEVNEAAPRADEKLYQQQSVKEILEALTPKLRETIILFSIEELEIKDIAVALDIPEGTVKSRLNQAREKLKVAMSSAVIARPVKADRGNLAVKAKGGEYE